MTAVRHLCTPAPGELAALLASEPTAASPLTPDLHELLVARLASTLGQDRAGRRIDAFVAEHGPARFTSPFSWSTRSARRPLGTAALRRVATGHARDVRRGAFEEIDALCDRARRGLARRGALGTWLADAPDDVRALCAVEAATWASGVLHLVDPAATGLEVGVADAWFAVPGVRTSMCGRRDVLGEGVTGRHGVLRLRDGLPGPRALDGLLVDGLVDALASDTNQPSVVVGCWPDAGFCLSVEFDETSARRAARTVLLCATSLAPTGPELHVTTVAA